MYSLKFHPIQSSCKLHSLVIHSSSLLYMIVFPNVSSHTIIVFAFLGDSFLIITIYDGISSYIILYNHYIAFPLHSLVIHSSSLLYMIEFPHVSSHTIIVLHSLVIHSSSLLYMIEISHISSYTITILHFNCDSIHIITIYNWISIMLHPYNIYCICLVIYST